MNFLGSSGRNSPAPMARQQSNSNQQQQSTHQTPGAFSDNASVGSASYFGGIADDDDRSGNGAPSTQATSVSAGNGYEGVKKVGFGIGTMSLTESDNNQQLHNRQNSGSGGADQRRSTVTSTYEDARATPDRNSYADVAEMQLPDSPLSNNNNDDGANNWSVDQNVTVAGHANVSAWEQTGAASMAGNDPVAQATDFQDGDIIFMSSETGSGPTRQPATRFKIHEVNLNVHSAVLSEMVDGADPNMAHQLEEDGATLKLLFGLFYNNPAPGLTMSDWQVVLRLARAAQKYDCSRAKDVAASFFAEQEQLGSLSPFMTYAFGTMYQLPALEEAAAERSVRYDIHRLPELVFNLMGYAAYQKLSAFQTRRQTHYHDVLNSITIDPQELSDQCYATSGVCCIGPWSKLKRKLAWPRTTDSDGSKKPPEPADVIRKLVTEVGQIDCGTCSRALVEAALQAQLALESMPRYGENSEESF